MVFFNYIVSLSLRACVLIPIVVAVRFLINKYPKKYSYALWIMVFISLIVKISVPGTIDTPVSRAQHIMQQQYSNVLNSYAEEVVIHKENTEEYNNAVQQGIQPIISEKAKYVITSKDDITPPKTVQKSVMPTVSVVWFAGVMIFLIIYLKNIAAILSAIKFAVHYKYDIYYSEYIKSPFVFGIIKPKIYLPYTITKQQAEAVIQHERVHIKRLDYLVKPICFFITALHWFNPFVWIAFYLMTKDMEHSCDESVIKYADEQDKKDYCNALLQFALKDKDYKIGTVMFGESDCSSRIKNVLSFKNPKKFISIMLVLVVLAIAVVAVTAEKEAEQPANQFEGMTFAQLEEYKKGEIMQSDNDLNERLQILQAMDKKADSEIAAYIAKEIAAYCEKDNFAKLKDVTVIQDHLTLIQNKTQKPLCNAEVKISLELYPYTDVDIKSQAEEYCRKMYSYLCGEYNDEQFVPNLDFIAYKTKQFTAEVCSEKGEHIASCEIAENNSFENPQLLKKPNVWIQDLSQSEQAALNKAFGYSQNTFILKKFGIDNNNKLYIEYTFEDDWLLKGEGTAEEKIAAKTAQLNDIYVDISQKIVQSSAVQQYIAQNNVGTTVVAFSHRFLENGIVKFPMVNNHQEPQFTHDIETEDSLNADNMFSQYDESILPPEYGVDIVWPIINSPHHISAVYGKRSSYGYEDFHYGIDIAAENKTPINAICNGVVEESVKSDIGNGNYVIIDHQNGYKSMYAHCDELFVEKGDIVEKRQVIATVGTSGNSTGPHLHLQVERNGQIIDPVYIFGEFSTCTKCYSNKMIYHKEYPFKWEYDFQKECQCGLKNGVDVYFEGIKKVEIVCVECGNIELIEQCMADMVCYGFN